MPAASPATAVGKLTVTGSKQKGRVTAPAAMEKGSWQITGEIDIKAADGKAIKVAKPGEKPPDINLDL